MNRQTIEELESKAKLFFEQARSVKDTSRQKFKAEHKLTRSCVDLVFPASKWQALQDEWTLVRIRAAMEEVQTSSTVKEHFTIQTILQRLKGTGIWIERFMRVSGNEWNERRKQLPTCQEKVVQTIEELVNRRIPLKELTIKLIFETAGMKPRAGQWLRDAVLAARRDLLKHQIDNDIVPPAESGSALVLPSLWIDIDADAWDLRAGGGCRLNRTLLRNDIANIAWQQMKEALLEEHLTCSTVSIHYRGYRLAGELLGSEIPDVRKATLRKVRRAWLKYKGKSKELENIHSALKRIFTDLCKPEAKETGVDVEEMLLISAWLYTSVSVKTGSPNQDFLSDAEMNDIIARCLIDIKCGLAFTESAPDLLNSYTRPRGSNSSAAVVQWTGALMLLLMLFTGLRPQSVVTLKIGDWEEIRPGLFAIIWSHSKKREEKLAILPASLAYLINEYVKRTASLRKALGTATVFLTSNRNGFWSPTQREGYLRDCILPAFVRRHNLRRGEMLLKLNCLMLRRTYVTRELYMGRSIWALQLQLGHDSLRTTRRYGKFDLFEHPAEVGAALDDYGLKSLSLWRYPLQLSDLDVSERENLLGMKDERHQDIGICRHSCCLKALSGNPPPCSLCEHLVTGPEFLRAWEAEQEIREDEIERLKSTHDADHLLAQRESQYEMFKVNLSYVKDKKYQ